MLAWATGIAALAFFFAFGFRRINYCIPQNVAWLKTTPVAHRGLHNDDFDENSLGAFANAISHGYAVELDVRLTKDLVPVIIHDSSLERTFGINNLVSKTSLDELKKLTLPKSGETIPTFAEALELIDGQVPILIDMKNFGLPGDFESKTLDILKNYKGEYAFQAFNPMTCKWLKNHDKDLIVGLLLDDVPFLRFKLLRNFKDNLFAKIASPGFIGYNYNTISEEVTKAYRENGVTVLGWGLLEEDLHNTEYLRLVDNAIFDISHP